MKIIKRTTANSASALRFLIMLLSFRISTGQALEVTHQVRPNSDFSTSSLNFSCSTFFTSPVPYKCNPALFPYAENEGISLSVIGKSDGDSIDNGRELIFKPVTESLIRKLFQESSFSSFTFNSNIAFKTKYFDLSYSPYYLLADLFLFNPAFPEISLHLANREMLQLTSGIELDTWQLPGGDYSLSLGGDLYYYEHVYENVIFSLFDLSFKKPEELISLKTETGVSGNLGLFLKNTNLFIPNISLQVRNINSKLGRESMGSEVFRQKTKYLFETYSSMGMGKSYTTRWGGIDLNLELPFDNYFESYHTDHLTLAGRYNLRLFTFTANASKLYQSFGLKFNSTTFDVGITYSQEKDLNDFRSISQRSVYTGVDINL